nr:MAG TPA: hypothetical protein [Caudoviricetes sp.]
MECYASNCPFRVNESSGQHVCECVACPNRTTAVILRTTNRTLAAGELEWLEVTLTKNTDLVMSD